MTDFDFEAQFVTEDYLWALEKSDGYLLGTSMRVLAETLSGRGQSTWGWMKKAGS
jgi:hypothetical protein